MTSEALATIPTPPPPSSTVELSFDNVANQLFKKVENCVYDLRTGQLGVLRGSKDAYAVFVPGEDEGEGEGENKHKHKRKAQMQVCPVTSFGLPIPAYAIRTKIDELKPGDVVIVEGQNSETWLYYLRHEKEGDLVKNASVFGIRVEDGVMTEVMLSDSMFVPDNGVLCVKNMIGKETELTKMLPMLALMGAGGKGEESKDKFSKLILCMLMSQSSDRSGKGLDMKSMLPMMMLNGAGDNMLMPMLLLQNGGLFGK